MALSGIPPWNDQDIALYHGTVQAHAFGIMNRVDVNQGQPLRDFGRGFYTTTNEQQAEAWANQLARIQGDAPAVIRFEVERNAMAQLDCLVFVRGDLRRH